MITLVPRHHVSNDGARESAARIWLAVKTSVKSAYPAVFRLAICAAAIAAVIGLKLAIWMPMYWR